MQIKFWIMTVLGIAILLAGCGSGNDEAEASGRPEKLRLAITDVTGLEELQRDFGEFQEEFSEVLDMEVEFFPVTNRTAAAEALNSNQVDLVFTGPSEYVVMRSETDAIPVIGITRPGYRSVIVTHVDSDITTLEDLKGKTISMGDPGSTSGHLGPSKILADNGLDPESDVEPMLLGDAQVPAFINGETDAIGISYLGFEELLEENGRSVDEFTILAEGPDFPNDVFVASPDLSEEFREELRDVMVENQQALIDAMLASGENAKYEASELSPAEDADYEYMREAYRAIGIDDFSEVE